MITVITLFKGFDKRKFTKEMESSDTSNTEILFLDQLNNDEVKIYLDAIRSVYTSIDYLIFVDQNSELRDWLNTEGYNIINIVPSMERCLEFTQYMTERSHLSFETMREVLETWNEHLKDVCEEEDKESIYELPIGVYLEDITDIISDITDKD